jgi:hypothetical protein
MISKSLLQGQDATKNNQLAGQPTIPNKQVQVVKLMLEVTPLWMMHRLALEVSVFSTSLKTLLQCKKLHQVGFHTTLPKHKDCTWTLLLTSTLNDLK